MIPDCATCNNVGWLCCDHTGQPADFDGDGCCGTDGLGCFVAESCPNCPRAALGEKSIRDDLFTKGGADG